MKTSPVASSTPGPAVAITADRPLLGILLMVGFCIVAPLGDAAAKLVGDAVPLVQLLILRFLFQAVLFLPVIHAMGLRLAMPRRLLGLTVLRTVLHIAGIASFFLALRYLPLADAVAIAFVMPFLTLLLGWLFLGEEVGPRRVAACAVGFAGTLLVVQPAFANFGLPALLPLGMALAFSLFMLVSRHIARECDPLVLQSVSGMVGLPILFAVLLAGFGTGLHDFGVVVPGMRDTWLILAIGILGSGGHLLMVWSLRFAPSATVAPVQYLEIPMATLLGWLVFSELPNRLAALGIAITIAAGLYILFRERRLAQPRPPEI